VTRFSAGDKGAKARQRFKKLLHFGHFFISHHRLGLDYSDALLHSGHVENTEPVTAKRRDLERLNKYKRGGGGKKRRLGNPAPEKGTADSRESHVLTSPTRNHTHIPEGLGQKSASTAGKREPGRLSVGGAWRIEAKAVNGVGGVGACGVICGARGGRITGQRGSLAWGSVFDYESSMSRVPRI